MGCYSMITGQSQRSSDVIDKCDTNIDRTDISSDKAINVVTTLNRNGTNLSDDSSQPANAKEELIEDMKDEMKDKLEISEDISENFRIERDSSKSCNGEVSEIMSRSCVSIRVFNVSINNECVAKNSH